MSADSRSASEVLREAIAMEVEGKDFFERASGMVTRKRSKDMFIGLASQENRHIQVLTHELGRIEDGKDWDTLESAKSSSSGAGHSVFSESGVRRLTLDPGASELDVIDVGIDVEDRSIRYYRSVGQAATDPNAKRVFDWLVGEESGHLTILRAERDSRAGSGFYFDNREFSLETE